MRSKTILISMAVIILLSLALVPVIKIAGSTEALVTGSTVVVGYYRSPDYHFLAYSYNSYGQPVAGTAVNVTLSDESGRHTSAESTNSSGFASWALSGEPGTGEVPFNVTVKGLISGLSTSGSFPVPPSGNVFQLSGSPLASVVDPSNSSRSDVLFVYEGPNGTLPTGYKVYYSFENPSGQTITAPTEAQMVFLGVPTSYATTFKLPAVPKSVTAVTLGAFGENGTNQLFSSFSPQTQTVTSSSLSATSLFSSFTASILALVVPLMAILVAYGSYGKDRATGVLESVLSRPVTRRGLALSRYISLILSISVALVVTMGVMEVLSQLLIGSMLSLAFASYAVLSLIVEAAAFVSILMILSHLIKSSGGLVGVGVGLWVFLDFFWSIIILIVGYASGVQIGSGNYFGMTMDLAFFNPAQFYSLVSGLVNGVSVSTSTGGQLPISTATYGLTPYTVTIAGALWIVVPVVVLLYLASKRD
jgi:ABC-2 type transport system permease protein